ncbi:MAG: lipid-A-disaccharide synthase [Phycisphaerae bacterium]
MSDTKPPTFFLSAAEASGDLHAANLVKALKRRCPDARFVAAGGPRMARAGCELLVDLTEKAEMLGGPIFRVRYWLKTIRMLKRQMAECGANLHIPVDSPALNWHLAAGAKEAGIPVFYYIAPQVWAWAPWRVEKMRRLTDQVGCILPFEQRYLRDRGVEATYVGHPLFDHLPPRKDPPPDLAEAWYEGAWNMVFAPGSRPAELKGNVRAFLEVARKIKRRYSKTRCIFTVANEQAAEQVRAAANGQEIEIVAGRTPEVLSEAHFALAKSGTVTLEAAWYGVPMVIPYRTSRLLSVLNRLLGRWFVKTPSFSLVNILAGRRIVPEIMPWHGSAKILKSMVLEVMDDLGYLYETREKLLDLVNPLRVEPPRTASDNAADLALKLIGL